MTILRWGKVTPEYNINLGDLAQKIKEFEKIRLNSKVGPVSKGFDRALYSTYISYLPSDKFSYEVSKYKDERGVFVEMLKTQESGQFSFFTAYPGVTRGGHYHHTKTEKFMVIKGSALFRFRDLNTGVISELKTSDQKTEIVDTIPGSAHNITNIGTDELIVMLWANEIFDPENPDTYVSKV